MTNSVRPECRILIQDTLFRYCRGVDRRDWTLVRSCFHDDAVDHHGDFDGALDDFIPFVSTMHAQVPFSSHFIGNCLIEFAGNDKALVETYFFAMLKLGSESLGHRAMLMKDSADHQEATDTDMDVIGRYIDIFERRDDVWRISKRKTVFDSTRTRPSQTGVLKTSWALGTRDESDPIFLSRRELGLANGEARN